MSSINGDICASFLSVLLYQAITSSTYWVEVVETSVLSCFLSYRGVSLSPVGTMLAVYSFFFSWVISYKWTLVLRKCPYNTSLSSFFIIIKDDDPDSGSVGLGRWWEEALRSGSSSATFICLLCVCYVASIFVYGSRDFHMEVRGKPWMVYLAYPLLFWVSLTVSAAYCRQANLTRSFWGFFVCLHCPSCLRSTKITVVCCCVWLYISSGCLNPVPHACVAFYQLRHHSHPSFLCAFYASVELLINLGSLQ